MGIKSLVEPGHISLMKLMELMSKNPAEFYRMVPGSVTKGAPADLVILEKRNMDSEKRRFCFQKLLIVHLLDGNFRVKCIILYAQERLFTRCRF